MGEDRRVAVEVKREEMTQEKWDEMKQIAKANVCAECGADLQVHTVPETGMIRVGCLNREHHGWVERETWTQAMRRGEDIHPVIRSAIEKKMIPKDDLGRAMNLLALRYPDAIKDPPTAALFIMDCARLDLDPLISPAEAVPVAFKSRRKKDGQLEEKVSVVMIITEDGWLSMAARGCKDDWVGPPKTMRLEEYLTTLKENKGKSREEIEAIARAIKTSDCKDEKAWYYVAIGRRRDGDETVVPGWFTQKDFKKAEESHLPAAEAPGNQARVRTIKKWVREVFPECRQRMMELTAEWYQRAEGIKAAQEYIDAEYTLIAEVGEKTVPAGEGRGGSKKGAGVSPTEGKPVASGAPSADTVEGEGFSIDLTWLNESLKMLRWSEVATTTFLVSRYKVDGKGTISDILKRLTKAQAEDFVNEINRRLEKQPKLI